MVVTSLSSLGQGDAGSDFSKHKLHCGKNCIQTFVFLPSQLEG